MSMAGFSLPSFPHRTLSIPIMLLQSSRAVLLLCATAGFLGSLGLAAFSEKEQLWETWMRLALNETPVAQLVQDIAHRMGNVSSRGAAELRGGHQVVPSNLHQEQERPQDVRPQPDNILVLQEVMEKLRRVNQSLELMLAALEDARSQLEKHLEHLKAIPDLGGQSQSATSSCVPYGSYFTLLVLPLVPASFRAIFLLLFLASSALGIPAISTFLVLAVAGHWLLASACRGAGRIRPVVPREEPRYRLTSTPERECDMELLQEELDRMEMSCLRDERPLTPGAAPRGGQGHSRIHTAGVTQPRWPEDNTKLMWGDTGAAHGCWEALGAQTLQPKGQHVPVPGAHQGWAAVPEESDSRAGILSHPHHQQ
ncbi:uncharacterized protein LOC128807715 isoform X2 [Vidua macroura]|uniref:uncharacterized protein LOC128807715 isoform X2 n=1 Tax=Vidua macroura TaxID=187451 RepID=UPI0023A84527|nr:uncharacterized protein LOC128807715 isoform X2 [Vidua macroura]